MDVPNLQVGPSMAHVDLAAKCQVLKLSSRCVNDPGTVAGGR